MFSARSDSQETEQPVDAVTYWDPDPLLEGTRVKVRYTGECPTCEKSDMRHELQGATGVIHPCPYGSRLVVLRDGEYERYRHVHAPGHEYSVLLDSPHRSRLYGEVIGVCVARAELVRL